jgi:exopolysaccharide biosynthesis polyprenyl glycosylphosphotransferase
MNRESINNYTAKQLRTDTSVREQTAQGAQASYMLIGVVVGSLVAELGSIRVGNVEHCVSEISTTNSWKASGDVPERDFAVDSRSPVNRIKRRENVSTQVQKAQEHLARLHPKPDNAWYARYRNRMRLVDIICVIVAVFSAIVMRSAAEFSFSSGVTFRSDVELLLASGAALALGWIAILGLAKTRSLNLIGTSTAEYVAVVRASLMLFGLFAIVSYSLKLELSRLLFLLALPLGTLLILVGRWVLRARLNNRRRARGTEMTSSIIVGRHTEVEAVVTDMLNTLEAGYWPTMVCVLDNGTISYDLARVSYEELSNILSSADLGAVIVAGGLTAPQTQQLAWELESRPITLLLRPMLTDIAGPRVSMQVADGLSLMHLDLPRFDGIQLMVKRLFDIVLAALALLILSPLLLIISVVIKIDDPSGAVIFTQERVGLGGRHFRIHKFRSMVTDAEMRLDELVAVQGGQQALFKMKDDPRITRVGRFIRKTSIDELPQFWDVLVGKMSIVGPRPALPREVATYSQRHLRRLLIKPGITGLWQIRGRSDLSIEESIRLDLRYVENWSLLGDIVIIFKTIMVVLRGAGSY